MVLASLGDRNHHHHHPTTPKSTITIIISSSSSSSILHFRNRVFDIEHRQSRRRRSLGQRDCKTRSIAQFNRQLHNDDDDDEKELIRRNEEETKTNRPERKQ